MKSENKITLNFVAVEIISTGFYADKDLLIGISATEFVKNEPVKSFHKIIKPEHEVPDFFMKIYGFTNEQLNQADDFSDVIKEFREFTKDKVLVSENIYKKFEFINLLCAYKGFIDFQNLTLDISEIAKIYFPTLSNFGTKALKERLEISIKAEKREKLSTKELGVVFIELINFIVDKIPYQTNNQIFNLTKEAFLKTDLDYLLELIVNNQKQTALMKSNLQLPKLTNTNFIQKKCERPLNIDLNNIFEENGQISQYLPYYELRQNQIELAQKIHYSLENEKFLLAEAGTGVGKSLAYLIPGIVFSQETVEKVIVSTNTKNLQEQLFFKDLPLIKEAVEIPFTAVLLKGRDNYVCRQKWNELSMNYEKTLNKFSLTGLLNLIIWMKTTTTGDISENTAFNKKRNSLLWKNIVADRYTCKGRKCANFNSCYLMSIRKKAEKANIIVTNHSLLLSDLLNEKSTFGDYSNVIIDEAHNLPDIAAKHLGGSITYTDLRNALHRLFHTRNEFQIGILPKLKAAILKSSISETKEKALLTFIDKISKLIPLYTQKIEPFFFQVAEYVEEEGSFNKLRIKDIQKDKFLADNLEDLEDLFSHIADDLVSMQMTFDNINKNIFPDYETHKSNLDGATQQFNEIVLTINLFRHTNATDNAIWLSKFHTDSDKIPAGVLNHAPLDVSNILKNKLFDHVNSLIFTSATLAIRGKFKYFSSRIGINLLDETRIEKIIAGSPFDYNKQTQVLVTQFLPEPKDKYFQLQATTIIKDCIRLSNAGTLILFTSYKDLNSIYEKLTSEMKDSNKLILAQGKGLSRTAIINEFKKNGKGIILGTSSFWEGVDIQGEALSMLILYKLPFQVPSDPIVEAYIEKLESENKNSFMHFMLPNALLKYKQGFGRLIRSKKDRGVVLTLDSRIAKKRYGNYFRQILPKETTVVDSSLGLQDYITKWFRGFHFAEKEK